MRLQVLQPAVSDPGTVEGELDELVLVGKMGQAGVGDASPIKEEPPPLRRPVLQRPVSAFLFYPLELNGRTELGPAASPGRCSG